MALPLKQEVRTYSSKYLDGTLMYPGKWLCTYALFWNSVWVMIDQQSMENPASG